MQRKTHIKKGDTVKVLTGNSRGQEGRVLTVDIKKQRVVVEGINMISKHTKPNAANPQGGITKKEAPIHISNLMLVDAQGNPTKVGRRIDENNNKLTRYSKKSNEIIK